MIFHNTTEEKALNTYSAIYVVRSFMIKKSSKTMDLATEVRLTLESID